jgi:hypothetical protein
MILWIDFETRSRCDLPAQGVYNYAQDASTDVLCMSYAFDDEEVVTWRPGEPFPERVRQHTGQIRAHNAAFERLIFWYVLQINFTLEQFYCTAAQARANCAPGGLEDVGRFASANMKKDHRGAQLIRLLSLPQSDGSFREDAALMAEMVAYCEQDVRAMRAVSKAMRELSADELADYHVNERINDRGVLVDTALCRAAVQYASTELVEIEQIVAEVTQGEITSVRSPKMREWVLARVGDEAKRLMTVHKDGEAKFSIDKTVRGNLLSLAEENPDEVPADVAEVVQCADDLWASSVAKFSRLAGLADVEDDRVRGAFVFAGGSATGRASSYGAQVHNFTRKVAADPEAVRQAMVRGHQIVPKFGRRVTDVLKGMLRPALIPARGHVLIVADWSAIEGRVHPWLANSPAGEAKLDVFRAGLDPYKVNAAATFRVAYEDVTGDQRQVGKVQELACLSAETKVLTSNGVKAIVDIQLTDLLWDGQSWVTHQGVIKKGFRPTINVCGVKVTPDHLIKTGQTWAQAHQLVSNRLLRTQALAVGLDSLQCLARSESGRALLGRVTQKCNVTVARRHIWSICTIFLKARLRDAIHALRNQQVTGEKIFINTLTPARMTSTAAGCLIGYQLAKTDAITLKTGATQTTARGGLSCMSRGALIKPRFFGMSLPLMDGISRIWSWTASTLTRVTSQTIFGLLQNKLTKQTVEKFKKCSGISSNLRPVFDILNSGPRNQFTILSNTGPLVVHNCGFLGGVGSFDTFGRVYGVRFTEEEAQRAVNGWRRANPWAMQHGQQLEAAYTRAMRHKGHEFSAGRVTYLFDGLHLWYALPSGRILCYPYARLDSDGVSYAKASWKPAADATEWPRARLWRGLACENITQAVANDVLRCALRVLPDAVLHVHDEVVLEVPRVQAEARAEALLQVMRTPPAWASGLPLNAEVKIMERYGK